MKKYYKDLAGMKEKYGEVNVYHLKVIENYKKSYEILTIGLK